MIEQQETPEENLNNGTLDDLRSMYVKNQSFPDKYIGSNFLHQLLRASKEDIQDN